MKRNPYHKHRSKGLAKKCGRAISKPHCPVTGELVSHGNGGFVVEKVNANHLRSLYVLKKVSWKH